MSWSTSELRVRLAPLNRFKPSSKIFYWPFQGGTSFVDLLCFCFVLCLLCLCARLFMCALWSPAGKGLTSWLSFVVSTVSLSLSHWYTVRCGTWLYRFLIFAPLLTLIIMIRHSWNWPALYLVKTCNIYLNAIVDTHIFNDYLTITIKLVKIWLYRIISTLLYLSSDWKPRIFKTQNS